MSETFDAADWGRLNAAVHNLQTNFLHGNLDACRQNCRQVKNILPFAPDGTGLAVCLEQASAPAVEFYEEFLKSCHMATPENSIRKRKEASRKR